MYEVSFLKLSERYYKTVPWPAVELIADVVDQDHVFCLLYRVRMGCICAGHARSGIKRIRAHACRTVYALLYARQFMLYPWALHASWHTCTRCMVVDSMALHDNRCGWMDEYNSRVGVTAEPIIMQHSSVRLACWSTIC